MYHVQLIIRAEQFGFDVILTCGGTMNRQMGDIGKILYQPFTQVGIVEGDEKHFTAQIIVVGNMVARLDPWCQQSPVAIGLHSEK